MSRDGYLPDNVSEADFDRAFPGDCPGECDNEEVYSECGGHGMCICYDGRWPIVAWFLRLKDRIKFGEEVCVPTPKECDCPSADEIAAERAEARAEERADRDLD